MSEIWSTDLELRDAHDRFVLATPGYVIPCAYGVARFDSRGLEFAHVNKPGKVRPLPAVILANVCGYTNRTLVRQMSAERFDRAIRLLEPAEAAKHMPHPNLWSWRQLLATQQIDSCFYACFLVRLNDPVASDIDARFREQIVDSPQIE